MRPLRRSPTRQQPLRASRPTLALGAALAATSFAVAACTGAVPVAGQPQAEHSSTTSPTGHSWLDGVVSALQLQPAASTTGPVPNDPGRGLSSGPANQPPAAGAPEAEPTEQAQNAETAGLRDIDVCAMHDPAAAAAVSKKDVADSLMPGDELTRCKLSLTDKNIDFPTFDLIIDVSTFNSVARQNSTTVTIDGTPFFKAKPFPGEAADEECRLTIPKGQMHGLSLTVFPPSDDDKAGRPSPCDFATAYIKATINNWRNPPTRTAQLTEPALAAVAVDPCASLASVSAMVPSPTTTHLVEPFSCVVASSADRKNFVGLELAIDDPLPGIDDQPTHDVHVQVNGSPAVQHDSGLPGLGCETRVPVDNKVTLQEDESRQDNLRRVEMAVITASTCQLSLQAANSISPALPH